MFNNIAHEVDFVMKPFTVLSVILLKVKEMLAVFLAESLDDVVKLSTFYPRSWFCVCLFFFPYAGTSDLL